MSEKMKTVTSKKEVTVEVTGIARYRLVVIPGTFVGGVAVAIVQVVNMIAVRDGNVAAALAMLVIVVSVLMVLGGLAFVPVALVLTVDVALVEVVGVILVRESNVAAACAVDVGVLFVDGVGAHGKLLQVGAVARVFNVFSFNNIFIPISINRANFFKIFSISLLVGETLSLFPVFPWLRMGEPGRGGQEVARVGIGKNW